MSFEQLGLRAELLGAVSAQGYTTPTPIQAQAIPAILKGCDVLARAQTGTGKTAAFALPMLQLLSNRGGKSRRPRALILAPTRELALQVGKSVETYGRILRLRSAVIFGGLAIKPQIKRLRQGVDILVATPGRLLDHAGRGTINLSQVEILVLDEADRMLDMGFIHDIRRVLRLLSRKRQNLLFSATYTDAVKDLADGLLNSPDYIEVSRRNTASELVAQVIHPVGRARKRKLLSHLITKGEWSQALVFTKTKRGADRLEKQLKADGIRAIAIHGNKSQPARTRALADFRSGAVRILVATDVASRGLDIDRLPHVVNYELPDVPEDYIHRIGRTGRAGSQGVALSLVCAEENVLLTNIQRLLGRTIRCEQISGFRQETTPMREHTASQQGRHGPARRRKAVGFSSYAERGRPGRNKRRRR